MACSDNIRSICRLTVMAALVIGAAGCGKKPDMPTACANRIADMFSVKRDTVWMGDIMKKDDGTSAIGGAVDTREGSESTRAFECTFDAAGKLHVEITVSDAE